MRFFVWELVLKTGCALAFGCAASSALAQAEIEVRVLEPVGFIAPGAAESVLVEIVNPANSGLTVQRVSGGGRSSRPPTLGSSPAHSSDWNTRGRDPGRRAHCRQDECVVRGSFPLEPGNSMDFIIMTLSVPPGTPVGSEIGFRGINLKLSMEDDPLGTVEYYTDSDIVRLISADGTGDPAIFEGIDLASPAAGSFRPRIGTRFDYVESVDAGGAFDVYATLTNDGTHTLTFSNLFRNFPMAGFRQVSGEHARSFRFVGCVEDCLLNGAAGSQYPPMIQLRNGESATYLMGTYFYESESLFEGQFVIQDLQILVSDDLGRNGMIVVPTEPLEVQVNYTAASASIAGQPAAQPLALQPYDLLSDGDQLLIYDPNTNLEWLRLSAGAGMTLQEVLALTRPGEQFENFQLASAAQVESLALNHVNASGKRLGAYALYSTQPGDYTEAWQQLIGLFGPVPSVNSGWGIIGIVSDPPGSGRGSANQRTTMEVRAPEPRPPGTPFMMFSSGNGLSRNQAIPGRASTYEYMGYWLVRE